MRKTTVTITTFGAAAAFALSACSSSGSSSTTPTGTGGGASTGTGTGGAVTAACSLTNPPTSNAKAPPASGPTGKASGTVGVILPDTTSSTRYTLYDKPYLQKALTALGFTADIQNAGGSTAKFQQIAQGMIGNNVKVLIIDSIDATSGAAVEKQAADAGVKVIDYDRTTGGNSPYVSFDNQDVGRLQGQALVDCLNQDGVTNPQILEMDGGVDVDNNAILFAKGANDVLKPLQSQGKLKIASESVVKGWNINLAAPTFTQALTAAGGKVDGVLAANDDIANAVIGVLKGNGLAGHVAVTGQDSGVEGLQNIITGQQSMTVFKNVQIEANAAALLASALAQGKSPSSFGLTLSKLVLPSNPKHSIPSLLLPPEVITQANVSDVIKAGALTAAQICKGVEADCAKLGIK